jgi:hypothetical protein
LTKTKTIGTLILLVLVLAVVSNKFFNPTQRVNDNNTRLIRMMVTSKERHASIVYDKGVHFAYTAWVDPALDTKGKWKTKFNARIGSQVGVDVHPDGPDAALVSCGVYIVGNQSGGVYKSERTRLLSCNLVVT